MDRRLARLERVLGLREPALDPHDCPGFEAIPYARPTSDHCRRCGTHRHKHPEPAAHQEGE